MTKVFLTFSPEDLLRVKALLPEAKGKGLEFEFCDIPEALESESREAMAIKEEMGRKIVGSSATLCLIGERTHLSGWVDAALKKSRNKGNKIIAMALKGMTVAVLPQVIKEENITFYPWNPGKLKRLIEEKPSGIFSR